MASFSEENFCKKLADLNNSQQSIQTLSLWLIHHRKHSKNIVDIWHKDLRKARPNKKITYLYLANDVIQNSKKKGPEFNKSFRTVLPEAIRHSAKDAEEKMIGQMDRVVNIWKDRSVFDSEFISSLKKPLGTNTSKLDSSGKRKDSHKRSKAKSQRKDDKKREEPPRKKKKPELSLKEEIEMELAGEDIKPPEPLELAKALKDLEHSASSDATVREKIAGLPPEVSDPSQLKKFTDKESADKLADSVDDAVSLLTDYNSRLTAELHERKRVGMMLRNFIESQKEALADDEARLQESKSKLAQVDGVRKELKSHIQSLPDMSLLPDVTAGLAPLPSVGDLFDT